MAYSRLPVSHDRGKRVAALAALNYVQQGWVIGVGTGITTSYFIDSLAHLQVKLDGAVAASRSSAIRLRAAGIRLLDLRETGLLPLYVDGADSATEARHLIKGGGGALTQEKRLAAAADRFVCIIDDSKLVDTLRGIPVPVEVRPSAVAEAEQCLRRLGGTAVARRVSLRGSINPILDVHNLDIADPAAMEDEIDRIEGVVTNGLFARRPADILVVGNSEGRTAIIERCP